MRIRIIGGIGSGKTYLARKLSASYGIPHHQLDDFYWDNTKGYGAKRRQKERDRLLSNVIRQDRWVIEGVYYDEWVRETFTKADHFISLQPSTSKRRMRVIGRFAKSKVGLASSKEKTLRDLRRIIDLDKGWQEGIRQVSKGAKVFRNADHAFKHLEEVRGKR